MSALLEAKPVAASLPAYEQQQLLTPEALAVLAAVNELGDEYALRGFARELTRQRMTLSIRLHGCHPTGLLAWLAPGLRGKGCTLTDYQIATALGICERTVRHHLAKLEATGEIQRHGKTRRRRLTFGVAEGLHEPPDPSDDSGNDVAGFRQPRFRDSGNDVAASQEVRGSKSRGGARSKPSAPRFCEDCHCEPCMCDRPTS